MDKKVLNIDSIRARLKKIARDSKRDFDALLLQFFQERLLYRLSISSFREKFILKGGLLMLVQDMNRFRPTKDIDFLGVQVKSDLQILEKLFVQIINEPCEDNVIFLPETIECSKIKEDAEFEGVRIKVDAKLGNMKKKLSIDIGFGDIITPGAKEFHFPVLIDFPEPKLKCYSFETVISEKFQAIVWLNFQTSRMKDFYDIYYLSLTYQFEFAILRSAIEKTFKYRETKLENCKVIFDEIFKNDKQKIIQWNAFLRKSRLQAPSFPDTVKMIDDFLSPLINDIFNNEKYNWDSKSSKWEVAN